MGALFYNYSEDNIFKQNISSASAVAHISIFEDLVSEDNLCIITEIGVGISETVQFFLTFDDLIHYYWFGKGLGSISCQGLLFLGCDSDVFPGVSTLLNAVAAHRGKPITCSIGPFTFTGVLVDCQLSVVSEPETMAQFTLNIAMTEHSLPPSERPGPTC